MSAPHADDRDTVQPDDRRNGHPSATVLDGPVVPSPRATPTPDAVPDPGGPAADGGSPTDAPAEDDVPGSGTAGAGAGGTAVLDAGGAAGPGGTGSPGIPTQQGRQGAVPSTVGAPLPPGSPGSGAPIAVPAPAGHPGAIPPVGPAPWAPGAAGPDGRAAGFPAGQPTPPMPWPAVRPTIGAPVPTVQPDEPQAAPAWRRALDTLEPARLAGLSTSLRGTVGHRTAAVAVGATLALAVGVLVAAYSGTGQESGDPQSAPAPPVAVPPDLVSGTAAADPATFGVAPAFTSPSGNIACRIHGGEARCEVENKRWTPPGAEDCTDAGLVVGGPAGSRASCAGTPVEGDAAELGYRTHLTRGDVTCVSRRSGVECRDARTGHGFTVARSSYRLY